MSTDTLLSLVQLVLAVGLGMLALGSAFALVLGHRHHQTSTRTRDLRLAVANLAVFTGMTVALLSSTDVTTAILRTVPFTAALGFLTLTLESNRAEGRIAVSVRAVR